MMIDDTDAPLLRFQTARQFIEWQAEELRSQPRDASLVYHSEYELLEKHGKEFHAHELPDGLHRGERGKCFTNAFAVASADSRRFRYVEGEAGPPGVGPFSWRRHAWVIDAEDRAFDVTWPWANGAYSASRSSYFGVVIPIDLVEAILNLRDGWGVLHGDELLRLEFPAATRDVLIQQILCFFFRHRGG